MQRFATTLLATLGAVLALAAPATRAADEIKIGFLVKQAEELPENLNPNPCRKLPSVRFRVEPTK